MRIFPNTNIPNNYKRSAIVIGNFDGIHKGHQKVFKKTKKFASKNKIKFGVLTFTPLPIMFFNKKIKNFRLISEDWKFKLLEKHGVDFIINIRFSKNFSEINAEKFIMKIIYKKINPRLLSVSNNFKFSDASLKFLIFLLKNITGNGVKVKTPNLILFFFANFLVF